MLIPGLMNGALSKPSAKVLLLYDIRKERACTNTHTQSADIQQKETFGAYTNANQPVGFLRQKSPWYGGTEPD